MTYQLVRVRHGYLDEKLGQFVTRQDAYAFANTVLGVLILRDISQGQPGKVVAWRHSEPYGWKETER
jgi:hypothetical protein